MGNHITPYWHNLYCISVQVHSAMYMHKNHVKILQMEVLKGGKELYKRLCPLHSIKGCSAEFKSDAFSTE